GFFIGQAISLVGDQVTLIALPLVGVLVLHAGAAQMGFLTTAELLPNLLFALHAGAWIDRRGRRRQVMIVADLGRAAALASIPIAYAFDALTLTQLYVAGFVSGTLSVLFYVSYSTLFVSLVPRERYVEANSLLHGSRALSFVGGPSLGGFLVQLLSAPVTLVTDAVSFLVSAFSLSRLARRRDRFAAGGADQPADRDRAGVRARLCRLSCATRARAPRRRARMGRARLSLPRGVPLGLRRDDPRHLGWLDQGCAHPGFGPRPRHGRVSARELRRAAGRRVHRRSARQPARAAADALDRDRRSDRGRAVAAAVADHAPARAAGDRGGLVDAVLDLVGLCRQRREACL